MTTQSRSKKEGQIMRASLSAFVAMAVYVLASGWTVAAEKAEDLFRAGEAGLASGDLQEALQQFARAARVEPSNQDYLQHYTMIRQVLMIRDSLPKEKDASQWAYKARALHTFYINNRLYSDALEVDQQLHAKLNNGLSALLLAETQLAMNKPAEAADMLAALAADEHTVATTSLHGLALARQGKLEDAQKIAESIQLTSDEEPGAIYAVARLHAAIGDREQACRLLVRCFESLAPSRLAWFKQHVKASPEFAALANDPALVAALQTESNVPESKCSGGSSCANCPHRGKCASGKHETAPPL
jgi:tetratricopeptide (TPR) repeat protein